MGRSQAGWRTGREGEAACGQAAVPAVALAAVPAVALAAALAVALAVALAAAQAVGERQGSAALLGTVASRQRAVQGAAAAPRERARKTSAIPPAAIFSRSSYFPNRSTTPSCTGILQGVSH